MRVVALIVAAIVPLLGAGHCNGSQDPPDVPPDASTTCTPVDCGPAPATPPRVCQATDDGERYIETTGACVRNGTNGTCQWSINACDAASPSIACHGPGNSCADGMACIDGECYAGSDCRGGETVCSGDQVCCQTTWSCVSVYDWGGCPAAAQ